MVGLKALGTGYCPSTNSRMAACCSSTGSMLAATLTDESAVTSLMANCGRLVGPALAGMVIASLGVGAACLGNPLTALAWLADRMAAVGEPLREGDVIKIGTTELAFETRGLQEHIAFFTKSAVARKDGKVGTRSSANKSAFGIDDQGKGELLIMGIQS